jgi:hypothetical protein
MKVYCISTQGNAWEFSSCSEAKKFIHNWDEGENVKVLLEGKVQTIKIFNGMEEPLPSKQNFLRKMGGSDFSKQAIERIYHYLNTTKMRHQLTRYSVYLVGAVSHDFEEFEDLEDFLNKYPEYLLGNIEDYGFQEDTEEFNPLACIFRETVFRVIEENSDYLERFDELEEGSKGFIVENLKQRKF